MNKASISIPELLKKYTPVLTWREDDQVWLGSYPDLLGRGAVTHGDTQEEALANLREMAIYFIEDELERHPDGSTIPAPSTLITISTPARFTENAADIERLRYSYGLSQKDFAGILGVSLSTYTKWASTERKPSGAAARLLQVAESHPEALGLPPRRGTAVAAG